MCIHVIVLLCCVSKLMFLLHIYTLTTQTSVWINGSLSRSVVLKNLGNVFVAGGYIFKSISVKDRSEHKCTTFLFFLWIMIHSKVIIISMLDAYNWTRPLKKSFRHYWLNVKVMFVSRYLSCFTFFISIQLILYSHFVSATSPPCFSPGSVLFWLGNKWCSFGRK